MTITDWIERVHSLAKAKGWHDDPVTVGDVDRTLCKLALVHSEISEAVEEVRNGRWWIYRDRGPEGLPIELADAVIRIMDLCGALGIDLEEAVRQKHAHNESREYRHGGKLA